MRLIDADALIDKLKELGWIEDTPLDEIINEMPTAYDVEKVVAELESAENYYYDDTLDAECNLVMFKSIRQDVAIDIVKKGGVKKK